MRGIELPRRFQIPRPWHARYRESYRKLVGESGLPARSRDMDEGERPVGELLSPILDEGSAGMGRDRGSLSWKRAVGGIARQDSRSPS